MSANSKIQWTHHTGGPWLGCSEVSPGCAECYARDLAEARLEHIFRAAYKKAGFADWETRPVWGKNAPRVMTKGFWTEVYLLNAKAKKVGERYRIFPSMIDWLDDMPAGIIDQEGNWRDPTEVLAMFLHVVHQTTNLDWLLLTKRPENFETRMTAAVELLGKQEADAFVFADCWLSGNRAPEFVPPNVWLGVSVEDQKRADERIPILLQTPAAIRFLSCEPLLGEINLYESFPALGCSTYKDEFGADGTGLSDVHWVIVGGESGPKARPCALHWIREIVRRCQQSKVPVFVKQLGARPHDNGALIGTPQKGTWSNTARLKDRKGGNSNEWPQDLRVREFPKVAVAVPAL